MKSQLLLFYTIFYIVLAALFAVCMQGLFASLDDREPTWTLEKKFNWNQSGTGISADFGENGRGVSYLV
ncbi:hypothetical protein NQ315_004769 [Exocentrus adspersus]|uniref:Uncharacterized protein n=1 Tax=Exocentrus adspersus TaxID=1586481 RepID=A0AAV8W3N7_9CUCU|nr:hypothetical protein NQ315_004769 [Exocentrus adspersus]